MPRILVFDSETTGLFPKKYGSDPGDPHMTQFSYIIYEDGIVVSTWNSYIKLGSGITISKEVEDLTGASTDICREQGIPIVDALCTFVDAYRTVDLIVAHNIEFDKRVIRTEIMRNATELTQKLGGSDCLAIFTNNFPGRPAQYCTIEASRDMCAILRTNSRGNYFKNPTLSELHEFLFGTTPKNLHNSLVDCEVCLRCYLELVRLGK